MASMPAPRAAARTWTRAKCQKSPGYSLTGSKLPSTRACSEADRSPAPKMIASSRSLARAISAAFEQALGLLDEHLEADPLVQAELRLELGEQHVEPPDVAGRAGLGHDDDVERLAGPGDDLDDVAVAPRRVEAVDPHGPHGPTPVLTGQGADRDGPRRLLDQRRTGVLEVEEHEVGARAGRLLAHALAAGRRGQLGSSGPRFSHRCLRGRGDQITPAARRAARRSGAEAEQIAVDRVVVGAERRAEVLDPARGLGQQRHRGPAPAPARGRDRRPAGRCPGPRRCSSARSCSAS